MWLLLDSYEVSVTSIASRDCGLQWARQSLTREMQPALISDAVVASDAAGY
jgi:hypothetical protein